MQSINTRSIKMNYYCEMNRERFKAAIAMALAMILQKPPRSLIHLSREDTAHCANIELCLEECEENKDRIWEQFYFCYTQQCNNNGEWIAHTAFDIFFWDMFKRVDLSNIPKTKNKKAIEATKLNEELCRIWDEALMKVFWRYF